VPIVPVIQGCEEDQLQVGASITMVGFGSTNVMTDGVKHEGTMSIAVMDSMGGREIEVGMAGQGSCGGDSGGSNFIQLDDGSWRVFGITSAGAGAGCGQGVTYLTPMHDWVGWVEDETGIDITPCFDDGAWAPTGQCGGFPNDPATPAGAWAMGCVGGPLSGASETCGVADPGAGTGGGTTDGTTDGTSDSDTGGSSGGDTSAGSATAGSSDGGSSTASGGTESDSSDPSGGTAGSGLGTDGDTGGEDGGDEGCSCRSSTPSPVGALFGLLLVGLGRRRPRQTV
jgi:MYXO-CTERM domain-containing protein